MITSKAVPTKRANSPDENYLVGWIPLSHVEYTMALRMLDEEHELPGRCSTTQLTHAGWIGSTGTSSLSRHFHMRKQSDCASHDQHELHLPSALISHLLAGIDSSIPVTVDDGLFP
jgi:hypothetical protein